MNLVGKRTYIVATVCFVSIIVFWYATKNIDVLIGLVPTVAMPIMRNFTVNSLINKCIGDKNMVGLNIGSVTKILADGTAMINAVNTVMQKFATDPDVITMGVKVTTLMEDFGLGGMVTFKK
jgi:hypothetical protein